MQTKNRSSFIEKVHFLTINDQRTTINENATNDQRTTNNDQRTTIYRLMKKATKSQNNLAVYQTKDGAIELRADSDRETVWATQAQIAEIFDIERSVITKHVRNIIKDGELDENSVCAFFAHTAADGKTYNVNMYNLDVILAVGYRTNSAAGKDLYPTVEGKAVHLLYFIIKNHPFIDGNKRSAAFSFVWFLKKAGLLEQSKITPPALTALTLFIAESNPKNKDRMVKLVLQLLKK